MASGFKVADAFIEVHLDDSQAKRDVANLPNRIGTDTDRAGTTVGKRMGQSVDKALTPEIDKSSKKNGDRLAQGMHLAIIRNSPLIAAGVGAALAAGAPAMIAGATVLFAGVGGVAAAQSLEVRKAWLDSFQLIRDGVVSDAAVLVPAVADMGRQLGATFQILRPQIQDAFVAVAPMIAGFTQSLSTAAQTAVPALVRAVQAAGPVMDGLGHVIEQIGSGLAGFFDAMSAHSGAAGQALAAIGDILGELLPILGELLGQGAELAADVLPAVASVLHVVAGALQSIAPVLPAVVAGFLAFKAVQGITSLIDAFGTRISAAREALSAFVNSASGNAIASVGGLKTAAVGLGTGLALLATAYIAAKQQAEEWASALLEGGAAARSARSDIAEWESFLTEGASGIASNVLGLTNFTTALGVGTNASDSATAAYKKMLAAMDPVARAQTLATQAQHDLSDAIARFGPDSLQANEALQKYRQATEDAQAAESDLQQAIDGVTQAMIDQANQALAGIDSQFAFQQAQLDTRDAIQQLHDVQVDATSTADDVAQAQLDVSTALYDQAKAAAQAKADVSGLQDGTAEYNRLIQTETLNGLYQLRDAFPQFGPVIDTMIQQLVNAGVSLDELGSTTAVPTVSLAADAFHAGYETTMGLLGSLGIQQATPTATLNNLPFLVTNNQTLTNLANLDLQRPTPVASLNINPFSAGFSGAMGNIATLASQQPTPVASMNKAPFDAGFYAALGQISQLGAQHPTPTVSVNDQASGALVSIRNLLGGIQSKTVTVTVNQAVHNLTAGLVGATGGEIGSLKKRRMSVGGRVTGPGTATSDDVPFMTARGLTWLGNHEWVIHGSAVRALEARYGKNAMSAINSGQLPVATSSGSNGSMVKVQGGAVGGSTYNVTVNVNGVGFADSELPRRLVTVISDALRKRDRELS